MNSLPSPPCETCRGRRVLHLELGRYIFVPIGVWTLRVPVLKSFEVEYGDCNGKGERCDEG